MFGKRIRLFYANADAAFLNDYTSCAQTLCVLYTSTAYKRTHFSQTHL